MARTKTTATKEKKPKTTKKAATKKTREAKPEVPKIVRPRVISKVSHEEYMDSVINHFSFRRDQVKEFYDNQKCPNACVQYMNAVLREFETMKKRVGRKLVAKRRNTGNHDNGALV